MKTAISLFPSAPPPPSLRSGRPPAPVTATDIQDFMPLVRQLVARFLRKLPPNVLRDDLMAAGTYGLIDSLRKNGHDRGPTFEWYARIRIRGAILDELRTQDWLTRRARSRMAAQTGDGRAPLAGVVAIDDLSEAHRGGLFDESTPSPLQAAEDSDERAGLSKAIQQLDERERLIVTLHYFQGVQLKAIAVQLGVSEPRVSQLHSRAIGKLRASLGESALTPPSARQLRPQNVTRSGTRNVTQTEAA
jgi:RNA polymerase sigma factor FliA